MAENVVQHIVEGEEARILDAIRGVKFGKVIIHITDGIPNRITIEVSEKL
uniref:Uncharacterized protein n=1 Tax=viral metagenome TaxID=1070528 RepID=A0A6H1ZHD7_9ZZZZ